MFYSPLTESKEKKTPCSLTIYQQIHLKYEISHLTELRQSFLEALDVLLSDHYEPLFPPVYSNIFLSQFKYFSVTVQI